MFFVGNVLLCQSTAELGQLATDTGQSAYRGKQLYDGLLHGARKLDEINNVTFVFPKPCPCFSVFALAAAVALLSAAFMP